jgi:hypothetical protein
MVVAAGFGERMRTAVDGCVADDQDGDWIDLQQFEAV